MTLEPHQVRQKALAFVDSLSKLTAKEREQPPTVQYGREFNRLLELAKEAVPNIDDRLWPEPVGFKKPEYFDEITNATYGEIETYAHQIVNLIPEEPLAPFVG